MQEKLITFPTAELALSKGFYRETMGHSRTSVRYNYYNHLGELNGDCTEHIRELLRNKNTQERTADLVPAPTQALLQKWIREVHGISVLIDLDITLSYTYHISSLHPEASYLGGYIKSMYVYSTYEQALEEGLQIALKLIK